MKKLREKVVAFGLAVTMMVPTIAQRSQCIQAEVIQEVSEKGIQNGSTTLEMEVYGRYDSGTTNQTCEGMEMVVYNKMNQHTYAISRTTGNLKVIDVTAPDEMSEIADFSSRDFAVRQELTKIPEASSFDFGELTSVAVSPDGSKVALAIQHAQYNQDGCVLVYSCKDDGSLSDGIFLKAGVQPDMVTFADDTTILCANEGEPRMGYSNGYEDPEGSVSIMHIDNKECNLAGFEEFQAEELVKQGVLLGVTENNIVDPAKDLEPEYIAVSKDAKKAYVSLQEANAVAVLDLEKEKFTDIYSVGFEDFASVPVDLEKDGGYQPNVYATLVGARMPDGVEVYENGGKTYLVTANEGMSRNWKDYSNETTIDFENKKVTILASDKTKGLPEGKKVLFGGRGFTIFEVMESGLEEVYDSGADFESITALANPSHFNCLKDDNAVDGASPKKGPEPKKLTLCQIDGRTYAWITIEAFGGIMAYDITKPELSMNVNYINSRNFTAKAKGDVAPNGLCTAVIEGKNVLLAAYEGNGTLTAYTVTKKEAEDSYVLYTNDVHNAYEKSGKCLGYASVAQYKKQLESLGYQVQLVDNGDAIQGGVIGTVSKGSYIKDIMKKTGYSVAIPGNHEFDFEMDTFLKLAKEAEKDSGYSYISCNFIDKRTGETVFAPYKMVTCNEKKIAYVGVTTPESYTKSTPTYFQDADGNYIYGFCEGNNGADLYKRVQDTIDEAKQKGADIVIVLSHLGTDNSSAPWTSKDLISNTRGMDVLLDGHSHSTIPMEMVTAQDGKSVLLSSTGTALANLGVLRIGKDNHVSSCLVNQISMQDADTLSFVNSVKSKFEALTNSKVAHSDITMAVNDPETGKRMVRSRETNLGDLCADAYRSLLGTDVAFVNGGGIRSDIKQGDISYADIIKVHPFGNMACAIEVTGQQIKDALELSVRAVGDGENGGFLQVSGLSFDIDSTIPSSVELDEKSMFVAVRGKYRVHNIRVGDESLDLKKNYTVASHNYMLKNAGDGYSMFAGSKFLQNEVKVDNQVLIEYITQSLQGNISKDSQYVNPYGAGRIRIILEKKAPTATEDGYVQYLVGNEIVTEVQKATGESSPEPEMHVHHYVKKVTPATTKRDGKVVEACKDCGNSKCTVIPRISRVSLSVSSVVYNGKVRTPVITVKNRNGKKLSAQSDYIVVYQPGRIKVGQYKVTVLCKGNYKGTVTKLFTIKPKSTSITKISLKSKKFTVSWKKQKTETSGYQVQCAVTSKFGKISTMEATVKNQNVTKKMFIGVNKGKCYNAKIRTYKIVKIDGKQSRIYSNWTEYRIAA